MTSQPVVTTLNEILGRTFRLYVQTHGYHWNVEGPQFRQLHAMFEDQYQNLWEALDVIAERIRVHGAYAPASVAELMSNAAPEADPAQSPEDMVARAIAEHETLAAALRTAIAISGDAGDEVSAGILTDRLEWHEKEIWMMRAGTR